MPRSSNGPGQWTFDPPIGVRFPYGVLEAERGEAWLSRLVGGQERPTLRVGARGSNPAVLTDKRDVGQRLACVLWKHDVVGSSPTVPTEHGPVL